MLEIPNFNSKDAKYKELIYEVHDYLFNEDSMFCCLPQSFINKQKEALENQTVSEEEIIKAKETLEKAEKQKVKEEDEGFKETLPKDSLTNY